MTDGLRILVTGGAGYLGSVICERLLAAGHHVTALDNLMHGEPGPLHLASHERFEFVLGDARDEMTLFRLMGEADVILPFAAIVGMPACTREPRLARSVNFEAVRMLERIRGRGQLVVFPTTNSGYGTKSGDVVCDENTPLEPISLYGRTKVEAEAVLLGSPKPAISLRLATVFGASPRMRLDLLVNDFVWRAATDGVIVLYQSHFRRNFVHIADVADCFLFAIANAGAMIGRAFNVGLDEANMSKAELASLVQKHVPSCRVIPAEIGEDPDKRDYIVSNARLREAGFEAARSLDLGIRELLAACRMLGRPRFRNA